MSIKSGRLVWLPRGAGKSASEQALAGLVIRPEQIVKETFRYTESDVGRYGTVKATWQDTAGAELREVRVAGRGTSRATYVLRDPFASEAEAEAAALAVSTGALGASESWGFRQRFTQAAFGKDGPKADWRP
ncbi:hypothetical protein [Tropicimonas sp. IMCC34043]|uniref:hypothetical protein n=1 Tax=Tropicimonas sp. IMCC34043 TaxID=2248760 RepID=UPI0035177249